MSGSMQFEALLLAGVVEHRAATDEEEVLGAGLGDALLVLGELGVALDELDLAAVDAAGLVAPLHEHVGWRRTAPGSGRGGRRTRDRRSCRPGSRRSVTPCAVSSALSPSAGPQTSFRSPKSPGPASPPSPPFVPPGGAVVELASPPVATSSSPREHAPATSDEHCEQRDEARGAAATPRSMTGCQPVAHPQDPLGRARCAHRSPKCDAASGTARGRHQPEIS